MYILYCLTPPKLLNCVRIISQSVINHILKKSFLRKKIITESKMRERKTELDLNDVSNLCVYNHCAVHWLICNFTLLKY